MKRLYISVLAFCSVVMASAAPPLLFSAVEKPLYAQDEADVATSRTITVVGLGRASAPPDSAEIQLSVSKGDMNYGPGGPKFQPFDEENIDIVKDALGTLDIDQEMINVNPFGKSNFDPFSSAGIIEFEHNEPQKLTEFLNSLIEELDDNRGPNLQGTTVVFKVEDCMALEAEAMTAAIENARARAAELAAVIDAEVSQVLSVEENNDSSSGSAFSTTCAMLESPIQQMGFNPFGATGTAENSPSSVEVAIMVNVTFAVK